MIQTLSLSDLVKSSEVIIIAKVSERSPLKNLEGKYPQLKNIVKVEKFLKGQQTETTFLEFLTFDTKGQWVEDAVTFPEKGERVLMFLKKGENGKMVPVNGIQGVWPLKPGSDKTLGMGFRYSLEEVEKAIQTQTSVFQK